MSLEEFRRAYTRLEYWRTPLDLLDTSLQHSVEIAQLDIAELKYKREQPASGKIKYLLYWDAHLVDSAPLFLGSIELRKMDGDVTEVTLERLVRRHRAIPYERVIRTWQGYIQFDKDVSQAVRDREAIKAMGENVPRRPSGRPHYDDDTWAHTEVNERHRSPACMIHWLDLGCED